MDAQPSYQAAPTWAIAPAPEYLGATRRKVMWTVRLEDADAVFDKEVTSITPGSLRRGAQPGQSVSGALVPRPTR